VAAYEVLLLNTAIPQIQAAQAGDTYVCPRDIQITANLDVTGNTILGNASTDTVQVNGYMGVGGAATSTYVLRSRGDITNGTTAYGIGSTSTAQSGVTSNAIGLFSAVSTAAASFTIGSVRQLQAGEGTKGAGSTITEQYGLYVSDQTLGASNFGIYSGVSSGSNKWNIYASGTAANYFAGNVGIGTSSPNASAILDAQSTTKGVRMPNMTTTQKNAIASPAAGLIVFDTTLAKLCVYSGAAWETITSV
jgi:hypothetical protein